MEQLGIIFKIRIGMKNLSVENKMVFGVSKDESTNEKRVKVIFLSMARWNNMNLPWVVLPGDD